MIKKRTVIAFIITIITIIVTNKYWLVFKPMPVDFDIHGKGKCNIEVLLNKKDNDKFNKIKSQSISLDLDRDSHASFSVKRARYPKRIKLIITGLENNTPIKISNFTLRNGKYNLDELNLFSTDTGKLIIKNDSIVLIPNDSFLNLDYKKSLDIRTAIKFDFKLFVIILVLTYLLTYKLSNYVADFKNVEGKSRIEILFLTIFFIFLFVPMSNINQDEISVQENRTLAKWQSFITEEGEFNYDFGKNFNEWFNDRYFLRNEFLNMYSLKYFFSKYWRTKNVIQGRNGWLFLGWQESIESYTNSKLFTNEELIKIDNYLNSINEYCQKNNKTFYFIIVPDKSSIYQEYYSPNINKISNISKSEQLIEYIKKHSNVKVIYPKETLLLHKKGNLLYWKCDTHWNLLGAYYGYSELMKFIARDYPDLSIYIPKEYTTETKQNSGDLYKMLPFILKKNDKTIYTIPQINNDKLCSQIKNTQNFQDDIYCSNSRSNINLLMHRDSFTTSLIPYLTYSFGNSMYIWNYEVDPSLMKRADVIILETVERYLPKLIDKQMRGL